MMLTSVVKYAASVIFFSFDSLQQPPRKRPEDACSFPEHTPHTNTLHTTQTHYTLHKHTTPHLESESASDSELDGGHSLTQSSYAAPGVLRMRCLCLRAFNACLMPHSSAGLCTQLQKCSERAGLCVAEEQGHSTLHKHRNLNNGVCATIRCRDAQLLVRELLSCREVHDPCEKRVHPRKMVCATCTHHVVSHLSGTSHRRLCSATMKDMASNPNGCCSAMIS